MTTSSFGVYNLRWQNPTREVQFLYARSSSRPLLGSFVTTPWSLDSTQSVGSLPDDTSSSRDTRWPWVRTNSGTLDHVSWVSTGYSSPYVRTRRVYRVSSRINKWSKVVSNRLSDEGPTIERSGRPYKTLVHLSPVINSEVRPPSTYQDVVSSFRTPLHPSLNSHWWGTFIITIIGT